VEKNKITVDFLWFYTKMSQRVEIQDCLTNPTQFLSMMNNLWKINYDSQAENRKCLKIFRNNGYISALFDTQLLVQMSAEMLFFLVFLYTRYGDEGAFNFTSCLLSPKSVFFHAFSDLYSIFLAIKLP
jgi:hypothetical protein